MRRVFSFICIFTVLVVALCVPAYAASGDGNVYTSFAQSYINDRNVGWVNSTSFTTWDASNSQLTITNNGDYEFFGFKATFTPNGYVVAQSGRYMIFTLYMSETYLESSSLPSDLYFTLRVVTDDSTVYEISPYSRELTQVGGDKMWNVNFALRVGGDYDIRILNFTFETNMPSYDNGTFSYSVYTAISYTIEKTAEMERHEELIAEIGSATDAITGAIDSSTETITGSIGSAAGTVAGAVTEGLDASTEEITEGYDRADDDSSERVDDMVADLESATDAAFGGRSDAEIRAEIEDVLSGDGLPSAGTGAALAVSGTFQDLLNAFGAEYQSLLVLALTLGLAAFLVGRSYRTRGD